MEPASLRKIFQKIIYFFYKIQSFTLISGKNVQVDPAPMKDLVPLALGCVVSVSIFKEQSVKSLKGIKHDFLSF